MTPPWHGVSGIQYYMTSTYSDQCRNDRVDSSRDQLEAVSVVMLCKTAADECEDWHGIMQKVLLYHAQTHNHTYTQTYTQTYVLHTQMQPVASWFCLTSPFLMVTTGWARSLKVPLVRFLQVTCHFCHLTTWLIFGQFSIFWKKQMTTTCHKTFRINKCHS